MCQWIENYTPGWIQQSFTVYIYCIKLYSIYTVYHYQDLVNVSSAVLAFLTCFPCEKNISQGILF